MNVWVVIPAYNEAESLGKLLDGLDEKNLSLLVVDDGSGDATSRIARDCGALVIRNKTNLGKGISLKLAIDYLLKNTDFDCVITMDADGQHAVSDVDLFLEQVGKGEDFIIGNRLHDPRTMPLLRVATNKLMSWLISKITGQSIPDTQCGFRLIRRGVLEKMQIESDKFEIESEIVIKAAANGAQVRSVPIRTIYSSARKSYIRPFADTVRFIKFIISIKK